MFCQGGDLEKTRRKNLAPAVTAVLSWLIHRYGVTRHRRCIETSPWIWNNDATGLIMSSIRSIDESNGYKNKKNLDRFYSINIVRDVGRPEIWSNYYF